MPIKSQFLDDKFQHVFLLLNPPKKPRRTKPRRPEREAEQEHGRSGQSPAVSATTVSPDEQGRSTNTSLTGQTPTPSNEGHADIPEEQRRTQTWRRGRRVREDVVSALEGASILVQLTADWTVVCFTGQPTHTHTHVRSERRPRQSTNQLLGTRKPRRLRAAV